MQILPIPVRHLVAEDLRVPAVGLVEVPELLEAARDVEDDVAVPDQPVRGEELAQRLLDLALPVQVRRAVETEVGLVGDGIGARERRAQDEREEQPEKTHGVYRSALMPRSGGWFFRADSSLCSLKLNSSPSLATTTLPFSSW